MDIVSYILARKYTDKRIADIDVGASTEESLRQIEAAKQQALSDITSEKDDSISDIGDAADGEVASIQSEGQTQISSVSNAGTQAVSQVNEAGTFNVQSIKSEGTAQKTQIQTAGQDAVSAISTAQTEAIEEIESQTTSSVNSVKAEGTNQINAVQQAAESEITDIQSEGQKQQSAIAGAATQALESIGLTEQAAIAQVNKAGTTQVGNVNDVGNAKIAEINEANSHSPQINKETGKWQTWDAETESYVDTEIDAQGPQGQPGQDGSDGAQGEQGEPGVSAGFGEPTASATTLAYGEQATVSVSASGPDTAKVFNFEFGIPQGAPGSGGGGQGGTVSVTVGSTTTGEPGTDASVTNSGDAQNVVLNFTIPRGETGQPGTNGEDGADGQAATITVGSVKTGDPGTNVIINNSGTENAAILDFTIPRGAPGADGQDGQPGAAAGFGEPTATVDDKSGTPSVIVTSSGPDTAKVFNFQFSGLKGADGANGADGQQGEPGQDGTPAGFGTPSATIDNTSGEPSVTVDATGPDTAKIFTFHFSGLKGQNGTDGADGAPGEDGTAATIQIGTVSTLEPGEQATVENVGTENAAILNFGIPKGEQGEPGTGGGGQGVPTGGTTGQVLAKASDSDYDTQWVDVEGGTTTSVSIYSGQATGEQTDIEVLNQIAPSPRHGDIGIVTHDIYDEIDSSNAYVYNTSSDANVWQPLNSKYNAEDVYFASNLVITANIGVQTIDSSGSKTLDTAGKNLKQVLDMIVAEEKNPSVTQPSVSVTLSNSGAKEVGTNFTPNYSCRLNSGSYQYGPATGVTATSWSISDTNSNSSDAQNGSLTAFQVIEDTNYRVSVTVQHTAGAIPVTNLGNEYASGQIQAGSKSANSANVTGYRNTFYGTLTTKDSLPDSTVIRGLSRSNKQLNNGSKFSINIPVGAIRVVIAYPATLRNLTSVTDVNGMGAEISSSFVLNTIQVAGENNYNPVDYKVYILDYANANDTANTYNVTI